MRRSGDTRRWTAGRPGGRVGRWSALGAGVVTAVAVVAVAVPTATTTSIGGYISEAGVAGARLAPVYRAGVLGYALALVLLALAVRRVLPAAAVPLLAAAPFAAVSAGVTCSQGCPLPPHERTTLADLTHATASIAGLGLAALALIAVAVGWPPLPARLISRIALPVVVPLLIAAGIAIVVLGRGTVAGVLERAAVLASTGWLVVVALAVATGPRTPVPAGSAEVATRLRGDELAASAV